MQRLNNLQGIRAIAFLAIFISHTGISNTSLLGAWGVSIFLCMSGFLMMHSYLNKAKNPKFGFGFVWSKIKRLYPLHIVTMLAMTLYALFYLAKDISTVLLEIFLQAPLIHIWIPIPKYYQILNGVSWYLCVCVLIYLLFPFILKFYRKINNKRSAIYSIIALLIIQISIALLAFFFGNENKNDIFSIQWITYYFPISRLIDFLLGCSLYVCMKQTNKQTNN
ncbi:MAG: acyltransferase, partial [Clostridia bacterium]|nr:acyltransferase [Clostridia bacterium]